MKEKAIAFKYRNDFRVTTKWEKGKKHSEKLPTIKSQQLEEVVVACDVNTESECENSYYAKAQYFSLENEAELNDKPTLKEKIKIGRAISKVYKDLPIQKKKEIKKIAKTNGGDKSQIITLVLTGIFLITGIAGIHRFYLGGSANIAIGIIQLLTLGCCGIWWLIDVIRIFSGDLKPPGGDYNPTL